MWVSVIWAISISVAQPQQRRRFDAQPDGLADAELAVLRGLDHHRPVGGAADVQPGAIAEEELLLHPAAQCCLGLGNDARIVRTEQHLRSARTFLPPLNTSPRQLERSVAQRATHAVHGAN